MKSLFKLGTLSLALVASLFMINNTTNAAGGSGNVTVEINAVSGSCVYATGIFLWSGVAQYTTHAETGTFTPSTWYCNDTEGLSGWTLTIQATSDLTGEYTQAIPKENIYARSTNANAVVSGSCATGINTTTATSIGINPATILNKASGSGQICNISTNDVKIAIVIPASQGIGLYTGALVIVSPR